MITILHNSRCGKSREGIALLEESGKAFEVIKYLEKPLNERELFELIQKLNIRPIQLVRQKEKIWMEQYKNQNLSDTAILQAIAKYPILMERPIVITDTKAIIGRPPQLVLNII
jgi:arsenate reductase